MIRENPSYFDTSNFPADNKFKILPQHKGELGKMKSEVGDRLIREVVTVCAKLYAVLLENDIEIKRAKGIKKYVINKKLTFDKFMKCVFENKITICRQNSIRTKKHSVYTVSESKIALISRDDKRHRLENSVFTLPYGHKDIDNNNIMNVDEDED